jgi:serine/threonine protein kinase
MAQSQPKYILTERIAQGGMAEIHLGKSVGIDGFARVCAFKRILPHYAQDNEFVEMFRNEANVAKQLQNKNIVQVFEFVSDGTSYMLVMDFVDGQDLRGVLSAAEQQRKRIPIELACYMAMETLSGLAYAHAAVDVTGKSMGIIHRDVSPQNILVSYEGDVKITDFGIAKAENQISTTRVGVLKGKFRYMSPEQASGYNIDARSDIFAVGIILYEMLTMARLFKGEDLAVLESVRACQIRPPSLVNNSGVPPELDAIVMKLLAKDPLQRYQSGREAVRDLSRFLYQFRPDFFIGELADFMQSLFAEKLEAARERLRSTLALPVGNFDAVMRSNNVFGDRIDSGLHSQVLDVSASMTNSRNPVRTGGGTSIRVGNAVALGQTGRKRELDGTSAKSLSVKRGSLSLGQNKREGTQTQLRARNVGIPAAQTPLSSVYFEPPRGGRNSNNSSSLAGPLLVLVLLVGILFGALYMIRSRGAGLASTVTLSVSPGNVRMLMEVDGRPFGGGKPVGFPVQLTLPPGQHQIILSRPGIRTKQIDLKTTLAGGKINEQVILERDSSVPTAQLRILTQPPGARVTNQEGWDPGGTTPHVFELMPINQKLRFRIQHPNCKPGSFEETLTRNDVNRTAVRKLELRDCVR